MNPTEKARIPNRRCRRCRQASACEIFDEIDEAEKYVAQGSYSASVEWPNVGVIRNETRCSDVYGCTWYARLHPTDLRRRLRKGGLPSGMCRAKWCRGRAQAVAEFAGSRGATRQEPDNQKLAPIAGRAPRYIAATEPGSLRYHLACLLTLDPIVPQGHLIDNRCDQRCFPISFGSYRNQDPIRSATTRP